MSNKLVCFFVLFFVLPIAATEKGTDILDEKVKAVVVFSVKSSFSQHDDALDSYGCKIIGTLNQLTIDDLILLQKNNYIGQQASKYNVDTIINHKGYFFEVKGSSEYKGEKHFDISVSINNENNIFQRRIKHLYDLNKKDKKHNISQDSFFIHFSKINMPYDIISLKLTKTQIKEIKSIKKTSYMPLLLAVLGIAGLVVYYFNLHSKCIALLNRN